MYNEDTEETKSQYRKSSSRSGFEGPNRKQSKKDVIYNTQTANIFVQSAADSLENPMLSSASNFSAGKDLRDNRQLPSNLLLNPVSKVKDYSSDYPHSDLSHQANAETRLQFSSKKSNIFPMSRSRVSAIRQAQSKGSTLVKIDHVPQKPKLAWFDQNIRDSHDSTVTNVKLQPIRGRTRNTNGIANDLIRQQHTDIGLLRPKTSPDSHSRQTSLPNKFKIQKEFDDAKERPQKSFSEKVLQEQPETQEIEKIDILKSSIIFGPSLFFGSSMIGTAIVKMEDFSHEITMSLPLLDSVNRAVIGLDGDPTLITVCIQTGSRQALSMIYKSKDFENFEEDEHVLVIKVYELSHLPQVDQFGFCNARISMCLGSYKCILPVVRQSLDPQISVTSVLPMTGPTVDKIIFTITHDDFENDIAEFLQGCKASDTLPVDSSWCQIFFFEI